MANLLEKQIERSVCDYARERGMMALKFTSPSHSGVCDRLFISSHGKLWFGEFKQVGKKATALQSRHHQELARRGVAVYLIDSIEQGKEIVDHESQSSWQEHHGSAVRYIDRTAAT